MTLAEKEPLKKKVGAFGSVVATQMIDTSKKWMAWKLNTTNSGPLNTLILCKKPHDLSMALSDPKVSNPFTWLTILCGFSLI